MLLSRVGWDGGLHKAFNARFFADFNKRQSGLVDTSCIAAIALRNNAVRCRDHDINPGNCFSQGCLVSKVSSDVGDLSLIGVTYYGALLPHQGRNVVAHIGQLCGHLGAYVARSANN